MAPITLSKSAFLQKKPGGHYDNYLSYLANHRGQRLAAKNADPLAPMSPQDINRTVNRFTGMYGAPMSNDQIQSDAQAQIDPIIAAITKSANDRATASTSAIRGLTDSYAKDLAGIDFAAPYKGAEADQAAVDSALQQSLSGAGTDLASQLKSRLAPIASDPAVQQAASGLADRGAAIGTTQLATGSNALSSLIANAAAAGEYGLKQPEIARFAGIQGVNQANSQAANDISTGTQNTLAQLPSIVQALRNSNDTLRGNRAAAGEDLYTTLTGQNVTRATAKAGLENQNFQNGLDFANTYGYDQTTGNLVPGLHRGPNGNIVKDAPPPKPTKPKPTGDAALTTNDRRNLLSDLGKWTSGTPGKRVKSATSPSGFAVVPGTGSKPLDYKQVVQNLMTSYNLTKAQAQKYVDAKYKPGQHGRPYPVAPPKGTEPLTANQVIDPEGRIYKLVNGRWVGQISKKSDYKPYPGQ